MNECKERKNKKKNLLRNSDGFDENREFGGGSRFTHRKRMLERESDAMVYINMNEEEESSMG